MTEVNLKDLYQMFYEDPDFSGGLGGNPDDSKKEAAWEEAQSRFKQHKNNEKALKVGINRTKSEEAKTDRKNLIRRKLLGKKQMRKQIGLTKLPKKKSSSKKEHDMNSEIIVNGILKDLAVKGIIKSKALEKAIPGLNKAEMSIPAIAGLVGAGAMLAKIFKLDEDDDNERISKQVVSYMNKNGDFFDGVAQLCEFICSVKDGEEPSDEGRGERLIEAASSFHKACAGGGGGVGAAPAGGVGTYD